MWRVRKEIHKNLGRVVQRCLEKQSTDAERGEGYETTVSKISLHYALQVHVQFFVRESTLLRLNPNIFQT